MFNYTDTNGNVFSGEWQEFPSHGIPKPVCQESQFSRINHLGNVEGGYPAVFNWTIPTHVNHERCVMRIRYDNSPTSTTSCVMRGFEHFTNVLDVIPVLLRVTMTLNAGTTSRRTTTSR